MANITHVQCHIFNEIKIYQYQIVFIFKYKKPDIRQYLDTYQINQFIRWLVFSGAKNK